MLTKEQRECAVRIVNQFVKSKEDFKTAFGFNLDELKEESIDYELLCKLSTFCGHTPQYLIDGDIVRERVRMLRDDRYCNAEKYSYGIVCFLDIVGFKKAVMEIEKFESIRDLFKYFTRESISNDMNKGGLTNPFEISIGSDSVLITCEKEKMDFAIFRFFLALIIRFRKYVVKILGTDIRASICLGNYIHAAYNNQVFFGPAIVKSVTMAEAKADNPFKYKSLSFKEKPIMISISNDLVEEYMFDYEEKMLEQLEGVEYHILNPYVFDFHYNDTIPYFEIMDNNRIRNIDKYVDNYWKKYIKNNKKHLNSFNECKLKIKKKYYIYKDMLKEFEKYYKLKLDEKKNTDN